MIPAAVLLLSGIFVKVKNKKKRLVVLCSGLILLNIPLAHLLFAKDFFRAWEYSSVLLISLVFNALSGFLGSVFTAVKNSKIFAISTVTAAIINLTLNSLMIPTMGAQGAAIATAISFFVIWIIRVICAKKYIPMIIIENNAVLIFTNSRFPSIILMYNIHH